ncbi:MAG: hypothetical protein IJJ29_05740 [Solobacterium sp.]|nr:hypothetical protein [Solobacterium sp.]
MNKEKMMKTAKGLYTAAGIGQGFMIAGMIVVVLAAVMVFVGLEDFAVSSTSVEIGDLTVYLTEEYSGNFEMSSSKLLVLLASALVTIAVVWYGLKIAKDILRPMRDGNPFTVSVSKKIRSLARLELIGGILTIALQSITSYQMASDLDVLALFREGVVDHIRITSSFDVNFIFIAFILYLLSYVFKYGEELQQLSDETL